MGLFGNKANREDEKRNRRCSELETQYKKLWIKGKTAEALATLNEMVELGSEYADYCLVRSYDRGYLYCDIQRNDPLQKKMKHSHIEHEKNNPVGKSSEKVGFYLRKILERYGEKAKMPHTQLSAEDNFKIGCLKTKIAYTYYYCKARAELVYTGEFFISPSGKRIARTADERQYCLSEPEGNEYAKYMEWIKDAVTLNQNHDALMRLALAYAMEYEKFGLERDVEKATAFAVRALQTYTNQFSQIKAVEAFMTLFKKYDIIDLLKELGKENQLAEFFYQKATYAEKKASLERKKAAMEFEHARVSMWEEVADVTWRDSKTGEIVENIDAELKKMEANIAEIEKTLASM